MDTLRLGLGVLALVIWVAFLWRAIGDERWRKRTGQNGFVERGSIAQLHLAWLGVAVAAFLGGQGAMGLAQIPNLPFWARVMSILALMVLVVHGIERMRRR